MNQAINNLYNTILNRQAEPQEGSYTCYLLDQGTNKILKKCGEECSEVIIATKDGDKKGIKQEIGDLLFHLLVLLVDQGIPMDEIGELLNQRSQKIGNLKKFHESNHSS